MIHRKRTIVLLAAPRVINQLHGELAAFSGPGTCRPQCYLTKQHLLGEGHPSSDLNPLGTHSDTWLPRQCSSGKAWPCAWSDTKDCKLPDGNTQPWEPRLL